MTAAPASAAFVAARITAAPPSVAFAAARITAAPASAPFAAARITAAPASLAFAAARITAAPASAPFAAARITAAPASVAFAAARITAAPASVAFAAARITVAPASAPFAAARMTVAPASAPFAAARITVATERPSERDAPARRAPRSYAAFVALLYLDLELTLNGRFRSAGAWFGGARHLWTSEAEARAALAALAADARAVVGHNLLAHDLPHLRRAWPGHPVGALPAIDTLIWSPLCFPERPYHRLVKDRALVRIHGNDPAADAQACADLFDDELKKLRELSAHALWPLLLYAVDAWETGQGAPGGSAVLSGRASPHVDAARVAAATWFAAHGCRTAAAPVAAGLATAEDWLAAAYIARWMALEPGSILPPWVWRQLPCAWGLRDALRERPCDDPSCGWCARQHDPEHQLRTWFPGMSTFRPTPAHTDGGSLQRAIVASGLKDQPQFSVLPTGGGKSICFQIPAFARFQRRGCLTVVVSPLQSLMKDQVDNLRARTSNPYVAALHGGLSSIERQDVLDGVVDGRWGLLYVSPEQLRNGGLRRVLRQREVGCWVLDEAHCLAEWGHDFRPDYWFVPRFIAELARDAGREAPVAAFTATAQPQVIEQVAARVRETTRQEMSRFLGGVGRENLTYRVEACPADQREARAVVLAEETLKARPGGVVVFCPSKAGCEGLAARFVQRGHEAAAYHAGLDQMTRKDAQERFIAGELRVICATSAFGMGVDKPDIRRVIHLAMTSALESYIQQAGRGGRDGLPADAVLLHDDRDLELGLAAAQRDFLDRDTLDRVLRVIRSRLARGAKELTPREIARLGAIPDEATPETHTRIVAAVAWLERAGLVFRDENASRVFQGRPRLTPDEEAPVLARQPEARAKRQRRLLDRLRARTEGPDPVSTDDLAASLAVDGPGGDAEGAGLRVLDLLQELVHLGLLTEGVELTAGLAVGVQRSSKRRLEELVDVERRIVAFMREQLPDLDPGTPAEFRAADVAREISADGEVVRPQTALNVLTWMGPDKDADGPPSFRLSGAGAVRYLRFGVGWELIKRRVDRRHRRWSRALDALTARVGSGQRGNDVGVDFPLAALEEAVTNDLFDASAGDDRTRITERTLLALHAHEVLMLRAGLAVFRSAMRLRLPEGRQERLSERHLREMYAHQERRLLQVQVMHRYAAIGRASQAEADRLVHAWFSTSTEAFCAAWLPHLGVPAIARIRQAVDAEQRRVVTAPADEDLVVIAGPGSGKTRVLVHRVGWLVWRHRVPARGILVLCYNRSTAIELRRRLAEVLDPVDARRVHVSTLHGVAMQLTGAEVDGTDDGFKAVLVEATRVLRDADATVDADDPRDRLLGAWSHLLVDELQDIDDDQMALLDAMIRRGRPDEHARRLRVFAVGDDDQNIYAFRGARVAHLQAFQEQYGATRHELTRSYRSTAAILAAANALMSGVPGRLKTRPITVNAARVDDAPGGPFASDVHQGAVVRVSGPPSVTASFLIAELRRLKARDPDLAWTDVAVLARHHASLWPLRELLEGDGIPVRIPLPKRPPIAQVREVVATIDALRGDPELRLPAALRARLREILPDDDPWSRWVRERGEAWLDGVDGEVFSADLADAIRDAARYEQGAPSFGDGVHLGTQHAAKGLEWRVVFVLGDLIPSDDDADSERRLAYVAMTRAREQLYLLGDRAPWTGLANLKIVPWTDAHAGWRPIRGDVIGLGELWLDWAGRQTPDAPCHRALAALRFGDPLTVDRSGSRVVLRDRAGVAVAALSTEGAARLRGGARVRRVVAVVQRTAEQVVDAQWREGLRVSAWWLPIVEVVEDGGARR